MQTVRLDVLLLEGVAGSTLLWVGLMVLVEGKRAKGIVVALASAMLGLTSLLFSDMAIGVFDGPSIWAMARERSGLLLLAAAAVGWYAVAAYHCQDAFPRRKTIIRGIGVTLAIWMVFPAAIACVSPDSFVRPLFAPTLSEAPVWPAAMWLFGLLSTLGATSVLLLRALPSRQGHSVIHWFIPATVFASIGATVLALLLLHGPHQQWLTAEHRYQFIWLGCLMLLVFAGLLLGAISTNRHLLGRPISPRDLFVRWTALLAMVGFGFGVVLWGSEDVPLSSILAVAYVGPMVVVLINWRTKRVYQQGIDRTLHLLQTSVTLWPTSQSAADQCRMQNLLDALTQELRADAVCLRLQFNGDDSLLTMHSGAVPLAVAEHAPRNTDARSIHVNDYRLGYIAVRGPNGVAYSRMELDLAEACAYSIANLYLHNYQSRSLEELVVRREHERREQDQRLQRVLHDLVGSNLDVIVKAVRLLDLPNNDLAEEISGAAKESASRLRSLLLGELNDIFPPELRREGLLAALEAEFVPNLRHSRYNLDVSLDSNGTSDRMLNSWLTEDQKRTLYGAIEEALRNAGRHAAGERQQVCAHIQLNRTATELTVSIADDGVGFVSQFGNTYKEGLGLPYYAAALHTLGGELRIESPPGRGTTVTLYLPQRVLRSPLLEVHHQKAPRIAYSGLHWNRLTLEAERYPTGRWLINNDLSDLTYTPQAMHALFYQQLQSDEYRQLIKVLEERQRVFRQLVQTESFKEIVDRRRLIRYITSGVVDTQRPAMDIGVVREHVRHVITMLRSHSNYELALSDEIFNENFAVKPGFAVLQEQRGPNGDETLIAGRFGGVLDENTAIVETFTARFETAWSSIPDMYRSKQQVIAWLEKQLSQPGQDLLGSQLLLPGFAWPEQSMLQ